MICHFSDFAKALRMPTIIVRPASLRIYKNSTIRYATQWVNLSSLSKYAEKDKSNITFSSNSSFKKSESPWRLFRIHLIHGSAMEGYYPHELILGYEVWQMKGTLIGISELSLEKSYQFGILRIRPLCFWSIRLSPKFDETIK